MARELVDRSGRAHLLMDIVDAGRAVVEAAVRTRSGIARSTSVRPVAQLHWARVELLSTLLLAINANRIRVTTDETELRDQLTRYSTARNANTRGELVLALARVVVRPPASCAVASASPPQPIEVRPPSWDEASKSDWPKRR